MAQVRYGDRSLDEMRNREVEATSVDTWATTLVATYETDPDAIRAVLPPLLSPPAIGGRETFGEPKKLAEVSLTRAGDGVHGSFTRMGTTFLEITGRVTASHEPTPARTRTSFSLKFLPSVSGKGFDGDPVIDLPVLRLRSIELAERSSIQTGEVVATIPADQVAPYVHQRYDDLSPIGSD